MKESDHEFRFKLHPSLFGLTEPLRLGLLPNFIARASLHPLERGRFFVPTLLQKQTDLLVNAARQSDADRMVWRLHRDS